MSGIAALRIDFPTVARRCHAALDVLLALALAVTLFNAAAMLRPSAAADTGPGNPPPQAGGTSGGEAAREQSAVPSPAVQALFGAAAAGGGAAVDAGPLRETDLDLSLQGILADLDSTRRLAVIARGGKEQQVYWLGDHVAGAEIVRIDAGRVVLRRNGAYESLSRVKPQLPARTAPPPARTGQRAVAARPDAPPAGAAIEQLREGLPRLFARLRTAPQLDEQGRQVGLRLVALPADAILEQLGLEQEDVILAVNGTPVRSVEEALQAYQGLRSSTALSVEVLRDGEPLTLAFAVR